ncbi:Phosphoribosylglycinamide formyltransferase like protein [Aduncisulcus paluster]|uniref:phosphoribosylglycinamide formyltransferase 1 n=1 Tax=Aduncisulcus paluster TaxID=2918883 RepID=A0ABQ5KNC9_9EUKA|nr:Phosphoribosylglycinamide formyltransferase like protein [Aduncisulcus paluster]
MQALIDAVESGIIPASIGLVVSDREGAFGLERAKKHNIPSVTLARKSFRSLSERDEKLVEVLKDHDIDFVMLAGYLSILTQTVVKNYENRIINIHPALIPNYCGKGYYGDVIHKEVLQNKEKETGVTLHFVDTGVDSGPIIVQERISVDEGETLESLKKKIHATEHRLIVQTAKAYCEDN